MEVKVKILATPEIMERFFSFDEVLDIRYYNKCGKNLFSANIRIPECNLTDSNRQIRISEYKELVIKKCEDTYQIATDVLYSDNTIKRIFASNDYWIKEYAKIHAQMDGLKIIDIKSETNKKKGD